MYTKTSYVYILASTKNGTLYIGVTGNLIKRIYQHKRHMVKGFTHNYNVTNLVYYEIFNNIEDAFLKEKQLKKWNRKWKIELVENKNPEWKDLYEEIIK